MKAKRVHCPLYASLILLPTIAGADEEAQARQSAKALFKPISAEAPENANNLANPEKEELGRMLFFDLRLSKGGTISCNSCHNLAMGGDDNLPTSVGHGWQKGTRNSPTVYNAVFNVARFWDSRAEDLKAQAKGPVQAGVEMASPPDAVVETLRSFPEYVERFAKAFPGERDPVSFDNVAKAIETFEATLTTPDSTFDPYLAGEADALNATERASLRHFVTKGCVACQNGVNFGGQSYHPFGVIKKPTADILPEGDKGRFTVINAESDSYVFRAAPLRNVKMTAPYLYSGQVWDLEEVVEIMSTSQLGGVLNPAEAKEVAAFLRSLTGKPPEVVVPQLPVETKAPPNHGRDQHPEGRSEPPGPSPAEKNNPSHTRNHMKTLSHNIPSALSMVLLAGLAGAGLSSGAVLITGQTTSDYSGTTPLDAVGWESLTSANEAYIAPSNATATSAVTINGGTDLSTQSVYVGASQSHSASMTVTGSGTTWTTQYFFVAAIASSEGASRLDITDGAVVTTTSTVSVGRAEVGAATGILTVDGATLSVAGYLRLNEMRAATGSQLIIRGGATVDVYTGGARDIEVGVNEAVVSVESGSLKLEDFQLYGSSSLLLNLSLDGSIQLGNSNTNSMVTWMSSAFTGTGSHTLNMWNGSEYVAYDTLTEGVDYEVSGGTLRMLEVSAVPEPGGVFSMAFLLGGACLLRRPRN